MRAYERLLSYVRHNTKSDESSGSHPSSPEQHKFASLLKDELIALGCEDVSVSENAYVYAKLSATDGSGGARLGFIAHMDTSPDFGAEGVNPQIHENYDGGDISLGNSGRILSPKNFPHLKNLVGKTLITTDGTTLLGADDKAGIAEIMTLIEEITSDAIAHGELRFAFTPDEEIGEGADNFDVDLFDADFAYTVDGGAEGSLEYENFNAAAAEFEINGFNVHPGSAKDTMINASLVAMEINSMLPSCEIPAMTDGYEGFYHLTDMCGNTERATLSYIVRDHDECKFNAKLDCLRHIEKCINEKYGSGTARLNCRMQYSNMKCMIEPEWHLIENARAAAESVGITPAVEPIRGGTDGARLSFMGLPCPNLGTAGYAFHGPYEHITAEGMDGVVAILHKLVNIYSTFKKS